MNDESPTISKAYPHPNQEHKVSACLQSDQPAMVTTGTSSSAPRSPHVREHDTTTTPWLAEREESWTRIGEEDSKGDFLENERGLGITKRGVSGSYKIVGIQMDEKLFACPPTLSLMPKCPKHAKHCITTHKTC